MDYLDEIAREQRNQIEAVEKGFDPFHISPEDIEKGRKAQLGEIRHWKDGDYKMTVNGWEYVKGTDPKSKKKSEDKLEPIKTPEKKEETAPAFKVGDTVQITDEALGLTSLMHLKGKDLKVLGTEKGTLSQPVFFRVGDGKEGGKWDVVIPPTYLKVEEKISDAAHLKAAIDESLKKLKATKETAIIEATNSYRHSDDTLEQIREKINTLSTLKQDYLNLSGLFDISKSEEDYSKYFQYKKEVKKVDNTIISWQIARATSELIQHNKLTRDDRTIMSNARTLIHTAQGFEKKLHE